LIITMVREKLVIKGIIIVREMCSVTSRVGIIVFEIGFQQIQEQLLSNVGLLDSIGIIELSSEHFHWDMTIVPSHFVVLEVQIHSKFSKEISSNNSIITTLGSEDSGLNLSNSSCLEEFGKCNIIHCDFEIQLHGTRQSRTRTAVDLPRDNTTRDRLDIPPGMTGA
jgi:hypothetical protein